MRKIFGITGLKGAGKDTCGAAISAYLGDTPEGVWQVNFADSLKNVCAEVFGLTHDEMYGSQEVKERKLDRWPHMSPREIMQTVGTECFRDMFEGVWIQRWKRGVVGRTENIICTDMRFADECAALKDVGAVLIRVVRPSLKAGDAHRSEAFAATLPVDIEIVNDCRSAAEFGAKAVGELMKAGLLVGFPAKAAAIRDEPRPEYNALLVPGCRVRDTDDGSVGVIMALSPGYGGAAGAMVQWDIGLKAWSPLMNLLPEIAEVRVAS
jgi:hypothetical protein